MANSFDLPNFLLGLAWLGELDREQIQRLWFPDRSVSTVEKRLAELRKAGLIEARNWSLRIEDRTVPQLARWSLAPAGHDLVKHLDQYPVKPVRPRQKRLLQHDSRTTRIIVQFILWARQEGLSSVGVFHEVRLDPMAPRPVCDALLIMQLGGPALEGHLVPWSKDPAIADERRWRFAIEADNDTEPAAVLRGKATAYRSAHEDREWRAWWRQQYGPPPLPVWVAPTFERCRVIHNQWHDAWSCGDWLITDDVGLEGNDWYACIRGKVRRNQSVSFAPALPAPAPSALPAPAQATAPTAAPAAPPAPAAPAPAALPAPRPTPPPAPPQAVLTYTPTPARPPVPSFAPGWSYAPAPQQLQPAPPAAQRRRPFDWYAWLQDALLIAFIVLAVTGLAVFLLRAGDICGVARAGAGATLVPAPGVFGGRPLPEGAWLLRSCAGSRQVGLDTWVPVYRLWPEDAGWMLER